MSARDYRLYRSQTAVMAAILRLVSRDGLCWHLVTSAPTSRVLHAVEQLDRRHRVLLDRPAWALRRRAGLPVARLVLAAKPQRTRWPYCLLADRRLAGESMHHVDRAPLDWPPVRPTYRMERGATGRWTWRIHPDALAWFERETLVLLSQRRTEDLARYLKVLGALPRFRGVLEDLRRIRDSLLAATPPRLRASWVGILDTWPRRALNAATYLYRDTPPLTLGEWCDAAQS